MDFEKEMTIWSNFRQKSLNGQINATIIWSIFLFLAFFVIYQMTLALHPVAIPLFPEWIFGADSMEEVYKGISTTLAGHKHLFFVALGGPLYKVGTTIYSSVTGVVGENLRLAFPTAIVGAINVSLVFNVFQRNYAEIRSALLFAILFGVAAATWIYSSFPETYVFTAFTTSIFFLVLIGWLTHSSSILPIASINALACYAAPQQILLAIIPCFFILRFENWSARSMKKVAQYALVITILFLIPYALYLEYVALGWKFAPGYVRAVGRFYYLLNPSWYVIAPLNYFVFSIVGPILQPSLYTDPSFSFIRQLNWHWIIIFAVYVLICIKSLLSLKVSKAKLRDMSLEIGIYIIFYVLFFLFLNPIESFLYTPPILLPWLLIVYSGFVAFESNRWRLVLIVFVIGIVLNNFYLIRFINSLR